MHRKKPLFHSITTQLLEFRECLRMWLSTHKDKSYGIVNHVTSSQMRRNKYTNNQRTPNRKTKSKQLRTDHGSDLTGLSLCSWLWSGLPDWRTSQAEQLTLTGKSAVTMSPHVLSPLYEWREDWSWWGEISSQPRMYKLPFLLFMLPTPFPILVWACTWE